MKNFIRKYVFAMAVLTVMACLSACSEEKTEALIKTAEMLEEPEVIEEAEVVAAEDVVTLEEFQAYVEELAQKVEEQESVRQEDIQMSQLDRGKAEEAFAKVNESRLANGIPELAWDESLYELACVRAQEIVMNFSHQRPDGSYVGTVIIGEYGASGCGENIAANYRSVTNLVNGWLNSQEHKEAMLDARFTSGVMGCYGHNGTYYWVNLFRQ